jgi:DNA-binding Lrp family transcriptional regulator
VCRELINETAAALTELDGVAEVYSVAGRWDLAAIVRARNNEQLADIVTGHMLKMSAITRTTTLIAFKAYSRYDLEHMFSIGLDEER